MAGEFSSAIGGLFGLVGTQASVASAERENLKNRNWQEKMYNLSVENNRTDAQQAYEWQKELQSLAVDQGLRAKREGWMAEIEGLRAAGLNPMLALNGAGISGSGGVGAPASAQANPAHYGTPPALMGDFSGITEAGRMFAQSDLLRSEAELNKAKADEIRGVTAPIIRTMEEQEAHIKEIDGKINLMLAQAGLFRSQQANTDANTKWQDIQNGIAEATKDYQAETIKWQLFNLRKDYEIAVQEIINWKKSNQLKTQYLESQINLFNQQAKLAFANIGLTKATTETEKGRDKYMEKQNALLWMQMPSLVDMAKWQCKNEREFRERYEEFLANQRRGQNMQLIGDVIKGVVGAGTSFYGTSMITKTLRSPMTTTYGKFGVHGEHLKASWRTTERGLGL